MGADRVTDDKYAKLDALSERLSGIAEHVEALSDAIGDLHDTIQEIDDRPRVTYMLGSMGYPPPGDGWVPATQENIDAAFKGDHGDDE